MRKITRRSTTFFLIATLVFVPFATTVAAADLAQDDESNAGAMLFDIFIVRPFGIFSIVLGSAVFVVSLPFSALGGNVDSAAKKLVAAPFSFTFARKLGHFEALNPEGY